MSILKTAIETKRWDLAAHVIIFASLLSLDKGAEITDEKIRTKPRKEKR